MLLAPNPIVLTLLQKWERGPASCQHCRSPYLCLMARSLGTFFAETLLIQKKSSSLQFQAFLLDLASEVRNDEFSRLAKSRWQKKQTTMNIMFAMFAAAPVWHLSSLREQHKNSRAPTPPRDVLLSSKTYRCQPWGSLVTTQTIKQTPKFLWWSCCWLRYC